MDAPSGPQVRLTLVARPDIPQEPTRITAAPCRLPIPDAASGICPECGAPSVTLPSRDDRLDMIERDASVSCCEGKRPEFEPRSDPQHCTRMIIANGRSSISAGAGSHRPKEDQWEPHGLFTAAAAQRLLCTDDDRAPTATLPFPGPFGTSGEAPRVIPRHPLQTKPKPQPHTRALHILPTSTFTNSRAFRRINSRSPRV